MAESRIDTQPGLAEVVAQLLIDGLTHAQVAEKISAEQPPDMDPISRYTITKSWSKHPSVRAHMERLTKERHLLISRTVESALEARITDPEQRRKMSVKELLEIRREILGPAAQRLTVNRGADEGSALAELYLRAQEDPEIAAALARLGIEGGTAPELPEGEDPDG